MKILHLFILISLLSTSLYSQTIQDSLKAHYKFDGDFLDASNYENDLEVEAGDVLFLDVIDDDKGVFFDSNSKLTTIENFDNSTYEAITISLWFKSSNINTQFQVMLQGAYMGFGIVLAADTGKVWGFFDTSSSGSMESNQSLTDDEWHHVAVQSDGEETSMYIDGIFNGSILEPLIVGNGGVNNNLYLGQSVSGFQPFEGALNELRIYNRFLSKEEIEILSEDPVVTSLNENEFKNTSLRIFPNPSSTTLQILPKDNYHYKLLTIDGKMLLEGTGNKLNLSELESGIYLLKVNSQIHKVIVSK